MGWHSSLLHAASYNEVVQSSSWSFTASLDSSSFGFRVAIQVNASGCISVKSRYTMQRHIMRWWNPDFEKSSQNRNPNVLGSGRALEPSCIIYPVGCEMSTFSRWLGSQDFETLKSFTVYKVHPAQIRASDTQAQHISDERPVHSKKVTAS